MASKFDICNQALVLVGANTITSFSENTTESKVASQLYETTLNTLLTRCRWRFATKQVQLSYDSTAPLGRWNSKHTLPADALIIHTISVSDNIIQYDRYNTYIYSDADATDTVIADYTSSVTESELPEYFIQSLVFELASLFAGAIARNDNLSELYNKRAITSLAIARNVDSQAQTTRRVDVNRFRDRRNRGSIGNINAVVES
tara:strand:- start:348 stop:956 length:609 start_codon:yes stop_codon:yes gene_type:complete